MKRLLLVSLLLNLFSINSFAEWKIVRNSDFGNRLELINTDQSPSGSIAGVMITSNTLIIEARSEQMKMIVPGNFGKPDTVVTYPKYDERVVKKLETLIHGVGLRPMANHSTPEVFIGHLREKDGTALWMLIKSLNLIDNSIPPTFLEQYAGEVASQERYQMLDSSFPEMLIKFQESWTYLVSRVQ